jgi:ElaB/YqjD/DUF883 family membrane-anchored ribosome-binding protein
MVNRDPLDRSNDPTRSMPASGMNTSTDSTTYSPRTDGGDFGSERVSGDSTMSGTKDKAADMAANAKDKAMDAAGTAKDKAADMAGSAAHTVDQQRDSVAGGLDSVAGTLRERADQIPGGDKTTHMAETAADKIQNASGYLRENDVNDMMDDVQTFVRQHPTESLVMAAAAGFLVGRMLKG